MSDELQDHGAFCTWKYRAPTRRPRGWWHDNAPLDGTLFAWAPRSEDGTSWVLRSGKSGFETREAAIAAARAEVAA